MNIYVLLAYGIGLLIYGVFFLSCLTHRRKR